MIVMDNSVVCPVCKSHIFSAENDFDICPVCDWENDGVQMSDHNFWGGANELTVNEAKILYELSKCQNKKEKLKVLCENHATIRKSLSKKHLNINWVIDGDKARHDFRKEHDRYIADLLSLAKE